MTVEPLKLGERMMIPDAIDMAGGFRLRSLPERDGSWLRVECLCRGQQIAVSDLDVGGVWALREACDRFLAAQEQS